MMEPAPTPQDLEARMRVRALVDAARIKVTDAQVDALRLGVEIRLLAEESRRSLARRSGPLARWSGLSLGLVFASLIVLVLRAPTLADHGGAMAVPPQGAEVAQGEGLGWREFELPGVARISARDTGDLRVQELPTERLVEVESGMIHAQIVKQEGARPVVLATPHLRVIALGTQFDLVVEEGMTAVALIEGRVRVESRETGAILELAPGESVRSDALRTPKASPAKPQAGAPAPTSRTVEDCRLHSDRTRRNGCLKELARRGGLAGQNALYVLGEEARKMDGGASEAFDYYEELAQRFPGTSLTIEGTFRRMEILRAQGNLGDALRLGDQIEESRPGEARLSRVRMMKAELLCEAEGYTDRVELILAHFVDPAWRAAATRLKENCRR